MEFEQIVKRLEWLDEEHRKDKSAIEALEEHAASIETTLNALAKQFKTLSKQLSDISTGAARMNQFDDIMAKQRADLNKSIEAIEKGAQQRERDVAKRHQEELEEIKKLWAELHTALSPDALKRKFKEQETENQRLTLATQDVRKKLDEVVNSNEEILRTQKQYAETHRQDLKRMTDIQGELTALRKRSDEYREKVTLQTDNLRNLEGRINELVTSENERKQAQADFIEQQTLAQVERDRAWKDWYERYESFKKQTGGFDAQIQAIEEAIRAAKNAEETYADLNQKLERRVNEISEMQRLTEDRLRQEWVTFKADEQKRWTGHALSQEESMRDMRKDMDKLEERATTLDDITQVLQDQLHQSTETTEQQLQELMNVAHEWLTAYERIMGHTKKPARKV